MVFIFSLATSMITAIVKDKNKSSCDERSDEAIAAIDCFAVVRNDNACILI